MGLIAVFFAFHRYDDHRRVRLVARRARGKIFWPIIVLAVWRVLVISEGTTTQFIYFEF